MVEILGWMLPWWVVLLLNVAVSWVAIGLLVGGSALIKDGPVLGQIFGWLLAVVGGLIVLMVLWLSLVLVGQGWQWLLLFFP